MKAFLSFDFVLAGVTGPANELTLSLRDTQYFVTRPEPFLPALGSQEEDACRQPLQLFHSLPSPPHNQETSKRSPGHLGLSRFSYRTVGSVDSTRTRGQECSENACCFGGSMLLFNGVNKLRLRDRNDLP